MKYRDLLGDYIKEKYANVDGKVVVFDMYSDSKSGLTIIPYTDALKMILSDLELDEFDGEKALFNGEDVIWDWNIDTKKGIYSPFLTDMNFNYDSDYLKTVNVELFVKFLYSILDGNCLPLSTDMVNIYLDELIKDLPYEGRTSFELPSHTTRTHNPECIYFNCKTIPILDGEEVSDDMADEADSFKTVITF
jgi:hypothetical protein